MEDYLIEIFGKPDCPKCSSLKRRLAKVLEKEEYSNFAWAYHCLGSEEGLVRFCQMECLSPNQIPAFIVSSWDEEIQRWVPIPNMHDEQVRIENPSIPYVYMGLMTDYSASGVITQKQIESVLNDVLQHPETAPA